MRYFDISNILTPTKAPLSARSLTHLNAMATEGLNEIMLALIGGYTTNDLIILEGFAITLSTTTTANDTATWTKGSVYYNGNIYLVAAGTLIKTSGVFLYAINTGAITGDPTLFTDGNFHPFHIINTITITSGTSGSGIADYGANSVKNYQSEAFRLVGVAGQPAYQNSFHALSGGGVAFKKTTSGKVELKGNAERSSDITGNAVIFTLPVEYYNSNYTYQIPIIIQSVSTFVITVATLEIDYSTGNVSIITSASYGSVSFDGISFYL